MVNFSLLLTQLWLLISLAFYGRGQPEVVYDRKLIHSKLNLTPKSYWCQWAWSTAQMEEIPSTLKIRLWGEDCRAEKSKTIFTYSLEPMIWHNSYNILALFHHKFCRVQGLLCVFKQKPVTCSWLSLTLPLACIESKWPSLLLQCKLLKIIAVSREVFRHALLFLVKYALTLPLITRGQRGKFYPSGKNCSPAIFFFIYRCGIFHLIYWNHSGFLCEMLLFSKM